MIDHLTSDPVHISSDRITEAMSRSAGGMTPNIRKTTMRLGKKTRAVCGSLKMLDGEKDSRVLDGILNTETDHSHVLLTTGLGLPADGRIPLRLPVLLVSGLEIMQRYYDAGIEPPHYLIYQATQFIAETNAITTDVASEVAGLMRGYIQHFIQSRYPDLTDLVHLVFDADMPDISSDVDAIQQTLTADVDGLFAEHLHTLIDANRRSKRELRSTTRYAAANVLLNGGRANYPFDMPAHAKIIMPIGGLKEKPFFHLTRLCTSGTVPVIPQTCQPAKAPSYYPHASGDITHECNMSNRAELDQLFADVRADYELLADMGLSIPDLKQLCSQPSS